MVNKKRFRLGKRFFKLQKKIIFLWFLFDFGDFHNCLNIEIYCNKFVISFININLSNIERFKLIVRNNNQERATYKKLNGNCRHIILAHLVK